MGLGDKTKEPCGEIQENIRGRIFQKFLIKIITAAWKCSRLKLKQHEVVGGSN